jgi:hypothetical protein
MILYFKMNFQFNYLIKIYYLFTEFLIDMLVFPNLNDKNDKKL